MTAASTTTSSMAASDGTSTSGETKRLYCGLLVLFVYLVLGGFIFHYLESGREENLRDRLLDYAQKFLLNNTCVTLDEVVEFASEIKYGVVNGLSWNNDQGRLNKTMFGHHTWDFINSLFFSCTVVTTIGKCVLSAGYLYLLNRICQRRQTSEYMFELF